MNLSSGYDASNQGERQRRRYLGHTSYPAPPASPGSVGPQSLPMPGGYRYPPSPTHFVYPPMMAYQQHNGQHVAPRQLPPYVSGPLPQTSRSPGGPQSSNPAQKASGWGGVPFATSDDDAVVPKGPSGDGSQRPAAGSGAPSATGKSDAVASEGEGEQAAVDGGVEVSSSGRSGSRGGGARRRRDSTPCAFFLKTGSCAYGDRCKFDHPYDQAPKVMFNSLGLPLRPGEAPCAFFLKNLR